MTPRRREAGRIVDLQVDEARKDERFLRSALAPLDRRDEAVLDDDRPGKRALDRVDEKSLEGVTPLHPIYHRALGASAPCPARSPA